MLLALGAMSVQQTFATVGRGLPPIIAPAIVADLAVDPALLGVYVAIAALSSLFFQLGCGGFIVRHGALRVSQAALALVAGGLAISAAGPLALWVVAAVVGAGGSAMSTPASSHLLARYTAPRLMPLVFAIKQTAVPVALLIAGLLGPWLTGLWGWQGALLATSAACFVFVAMLQRTVAHRRRPNPGDPVSCRLCHAWDTWHSRDTRRMCCRPPPRPPRVKRSAGMTCAPAAPHASARAHGIRSRDPNRLGASARPHLPSARPQ